MAVCALAAVEPAPERPGDSAEPVALTAAVAEPVLPGVDAPISVCGIATRLGVIVATLAAKLEADRGTGDDVVTGAVFTVLEFDPADGADPVVADDVEFGVAVCVVVALERPDGVVGALEIPDGTTVPGSAPLVAIPPVGVRI